jgi:hypothetical protein
MALIGLGSVPSSLKAKLQSGSKVHKEFNKSLVTIVKNLDYTNKIPKQTFTSQTRAYSVVKLVSVVFLSNVEFHLWVGNFFFLFGHITIIYILMLSLKISNSNRYYVIEFLSDELDLPQ